MVAIPRSSASWLVSLTITGIPRWRNSSRCRRPWCPRRSPPPCGSRRSCVSLGTSGILETARSPKNAWISALDCVENRHIAEKFRLARAAFVEAEPRWPLPPRRSRPAEPSARVCVLRACSRASAKIAVLPAARGASLRARASWGQACRPRSRANCHRACEQIAFDDRVERCPAASAVLRVDRFAERAHLHGFGHARQPRQPLRACRARNDPELHLRLPHLRRGATARDSGPPWPLPGRRRTPCRGSP